MNEFVVWNDRSSFMYQWMKHYLTSSWPLFSFDHNCRLQTTNITTIWWRHISTTLEKYTQRLGKYQTKRATEMYYFFYSAKKNSTTIVGCLSINCVMCLKVECYFVLFLTFLSNWLLYMCSNVFICVHSTTIIFVLFLMNVSSAGFLSYFYPILFSLANIPIRTWKQML